jgi:hypothetical protein
VGRRASFLFHLKMPLQLASHFPQIFLLVIFHIGAQLGEAHVSLTFPPARKYNLDYLDSFGSPPPCGMPKGKNLLVIKYV